MKQTLTISNAVEQLVNDEYNGWGYNESLLIVEGLEELEDDLGEEINFNVIDIRCGYSCDYYEDIITERFVDTKEAKDCMLVDDDEDITFKDVVEYLTNRTLVLSYDESKGLIAYSSF